MLDTRESDVMNHLSIKYSIQSFYICDGRKAKIIIKLDEYGTECEA